MHLDALCRTLSDSPRSRWRLKYRLVTRIRAFMAISSHLIVIGGNDVFRCGVNVRYVPVAGFEIRFDQSIGIVCILLWC